MKKPSSMSSQYWDRLSESNRALYALIRPLGMATYTVDVQVARIEAFLEGLERDATQAGGSFELVPDFQRGHVWASVQQSKYVESLLRGQAPRELLFNCPGWSWTPSSEPGADITPFTMQCVDGLQRLTAIRKFVAGELEIFGGLKMDDLHGTDFGLGRYTFKFSVYEFATRAELLQFYLDLNSGGTVHAPAELARVRGLLDAAK